MWKSNRLCLVLKLLVAIALLPHNRDTARLPTFFVAATAAGATSATTRKVDGFLRRRQIQEQQRSLKRNDWDIVRPAKRWLEEMRIGRSLSKESIRYHPLKTDDRTGSTIVTTEKLERHLQDEDETATSETNATSPEEDDSSLIDRVKDGAQDVKDETSTTLKTNPSDWTRGQQIGVTVGSVVALLLLTCLGCCLKRLCCGGRSSSQKKHQTTYKLQKPYVTRNPSSKVVDASNNNLPLGVRLHGGTNLRSAGLTGRGIRVAVIDSGIDKDHPKFNGCVKKQLWYRKGTPLSEDDHGTHVAGTIHMMAPDAELYDYRVFGATGDYNGDIAIAKSIRQACEDNCHVINMSLRVSYPIVPDVQKAVKFAYSKGVHMVCAAGNSGDGDGLTNELYSFPARWKETISVAAVQKANGLPVARFSESNPQVDYAGIGVNVTSFKPGGGYQSMSGTSMATPHVAGLIAALLSEVGYNPNDATLRKDLKSKYAIDIGVEGPDNSTGVGFLTYLSKDELNNFWKGSEFQRLGTGGLYNAQVH